MVLMVHIFLNIFCVFLGLNPQIGSQSLSAILGLDVLIKLVVTCACFFLCVCQLCTSYSWYLVSTWNQNIMTCWSYNIDLDMEASENRGTPQLSSIHTWIVHYKPSIFGYPLMESARDSCRPRRPEVAPSQRRWYLGSDRTLGFLSYFSYYPSDGITILTNDGITIISLVNG